MYPLELRSQEDRPCIEFTAFDTSSGSVVQKTIWFPCPSGIAISDSASYNSIQLGALGGAAADVASAAKEGAAGGEGFKGAVAEGAKSGFSAMKRQAGSVGDIAANAGQMAAGTVGMGDKVAFLRKKIMNPNSNTSFEGNPIRTFSFSFKMIARSQAESKVMKRITDLFGQKNENQYLPKIYSCYLQGVNATYNQTGPTFHSDGAPLEVDVAITYQETRALTRYDIETLGDDDMRGISDEGLATTQLSEAVEQADEAAEENKVTSQADTVSQKSN
jgi:hypothetical protein